LESASSRNNIKRMPADEACDVAPSKTMKSIAILVVHGIGSQVAGETSGKLLRGVMRAYAIEPRHEVESVRVVIESREVRIYEVWWADLLAGDAVRNTFNTWDLQALAWFPWMNWRTGLASGKPAAVAIWTFACAPVAIFLQLAYFAACVLIPGRTRSLLDENVADVLNYAASADAARPDRAALADAALRIQERFDRCLSRAIHAGADEVHVVAHSLGSVIAYRALVVAPSSKVVTLLTIGSPLEKFLLLWPGTVTTANDGRLVSPTSRWENFYDVLDPIANAITRVAPGVQIHNHKIFGRANFVNAHTSYESDPGFLRVLTERLTGTPIDIPPSSGERLWRLLWSILTSAIVIVLLAAAVIGGALAGLIMVAVGMALIELGQALVSLVADTYLWSRVLDPEAEVNEFLVGYVGLAVVVLVGAIAYGRAQARIRHYAHVYHAPPDLSRFVEEYKGTNLSVRWRLSLVVASVCAGLAGAIAITTVGRTVSWLPERWFDYQQPMLLLGWTAAGSILAALLLYALVIGPRCWRTWREATTSAPDSAAGGPDGVVRSRSAS
jgi:hypothetical protein